MAQFPSPSSDGSIRTLCSTTPNTIVEQLKRRTGFVSAAEVMGILGVSRKTPCKWANAGTIKAYRLGKDKLFDPVELATWIEARRV